jgi:hypothetical protein
MVPRTVGAVIGTRARWSGWSWGWWPSPWGVLILGVSAAAGVAGSASDGPQTGAVVMTVPQDQG